MMLKILFLQKVIFLSKNERTSKFPSWQIFGNFTYNTLSTLKNISNWYIFKLTTWIMIAREILTINFCEQQYTTLKYKKCEKNLKVSVRDSKNSKIFFFFSKKINLSRMWHANFYSLNQDPIKLTWGSPERPILLAESQLIFHRDLSGAVVNQYSGAPVHACPDFAMSRGNYLWERCGTVRCSFYREHPSYPTCLRDTGIFNLAVTAAAMWIRLNQRKGGKARLERLVGAHTTSDLLEIILAAFQARATPGIAEEAANIRRGIFIISDNSGEDRLATGKAWFIARIRDLNCRPTRGADGTRGRRFVEICSKNWNYWKFFGKAI